MTDHEATILIVDDAEATREIIKRNLGRAGYTVTAAGRVEEAIAILKAEHVDLVITDLKMPGPSGLELVRHVRENLRDTEVIMITGYPSIEDAVTAVKIGAEEYLTKPFTDDELLHAVETALVKLNRRRKMDRSEPSASIPGLIGESPAMQWLATTIDKAARAEATVLITGESGTGKELVARAIHYKSSRAAAPFVPVNCSSIPEGLLESELFGYVKGAFTGAHETRAGFFQTAEGGTVFLDEIGETPLSIQVKLLRFLQEKEVTMVGSTRTRQVDVRIITATNRNLEQLVQKGRFREDLFFRLNIVTLHLPPLRDRGDDILLLTRHFAAKYATANGMEAAVFTEPALKAMLGYHWPGNVRELENTVHRLVVMTDGTRIDITDLPPHMRYTVTDNRSPLRPLKDVEREHIRRVLELMDGNKSKAADVLGIDRKTLREKLKPED